MAIEVADLQATLGLHTDKFDKGVSGAKSKLGGLASSVGGALTGVAGGALLGATGAIVGIGAVAFDTANQIDAATKNIQASLGVTADEAAALGDVATAVYADNFAGSIEEAGAAVITARQQLGALADNELQAATKSALGLADVFGADLDQSLNSAAVLMEQFGLSQQQAFDLMASGMQEGLNSSGDFLDSIGEYSNVFADAGFSAEQMYGIMQSGMQGGVLGTDKVSDAIKEMGVKLSEGGDPLFETFRGMGLEFNVMQGKVQRGEAQWGDFFDQIVGGINAIEDPIKRQQAQVAIFGTMAEDLGTGFTEGLTTGAASLENMSGAMDSTNAKFDTLGGSLEGIKRQALLSLAPLGGIILEGVNNAMPGIETFMENVGGWLEEFATNAMPIINDFADRFKETLPEALAVAKDAIDRIGEVFGVSTDNITFMDVALGALDLIFDAVITGMEAGALILQGVAWGIEKINEALEIGIGLWDQLAQMTSGLASEDLGWLEPDDQLAQMTSRFASEDLGWLEPGGSSKTPPLPRLSPGGGGALPAPAAAAAGGQPVNVQLIIDGEMVTQQVSNRQGRQAFNLSKFGGEAKL